MAETQTLDIRVERLVLARRTILQDIAFQCRAGSHTAILGPNGAGKTTLLRAIVGLLDFEGQVTVAGNDARNFSPLEHARAIAYVPQRSLLQSALSVTDVVWQGRYAHRAAYSAPSRRDEETVSRAMALTDVTRIAERSYPTLSGGEQRRVLLARALATEAPIIALDEPTASLDVAHQLDFFERLRELTAMNRTIVTVLHDLREAERFCDAALVLDQGRLVYEGSAQLPETLVAEVFGVQLRANAEGRYERVASPQESP